MRLAIIALIAGLIAASQACWSDHSHFCNHGVGKHNRKVWPNQVKDKDSTSSQ